MNNRLQKANEDQQLSNAGDEVDQYDEDSVEQPNQPQLPQHSPYNDNQLIHKLMTHADKTIYRSRQRNGVNGDGGQRVDMNLGVDSENGGVGLNRKRRQIKIEKDELTQLFYQLIKSVNTKVSQINSLTQNSISDIKNLPIMKNKIKSTKSRKQQELKVNIQIRGEQMITLPRKQSIKQQRFVQQKIEKSRKKQEVLQNYDRIMKYVVHMDQQKVEIGEEQKKYINVGLMESQRLVGSSVKSENKNNKIFCVVQEVSLIINPIQIVTQTITSNPSTV